MTAALIGVVWGAFALAAAARLRPSAPGSRGVPAMAGPEPQAPARSLSASVALACELVGGALFRVSRRTPDPAAARRVGAAVLAGVAGFAAVGPALATTVALGFLLAPPVLRRRREAVRRAALAADLPEVVDLLVLAAGAGCNVRLAVEAVARRGVGPLAVELGVLCGRAAKGVRIADLLDELPARCGEDVRALSAALSAGDRYGVPLIEALDRLAVEVRAHQRRRTEAAARRVPVLMLFPLVCCILPAFALLTVAPLLAGALESLRL
ncbi:MAG TPA: type II secretion system F family protein [Acidimicrobiales bacterium]|nr:type II secretion system F family protein [Acidimicrobiales bacterium]